MAASVEVFQRRLNESLALFRGLCIHRRTKAAQFYLYGRLRKRSRPIFDACASSCNLWDVKLLKTKGINEALAIRCDNRPQGKYGSIGIRTVLHLSSISSRARPAF
jgi:hypothetical protein